MANTKASDFTVGVYDLMLNGFIRKRAEQLLTDRLHVKDIAEAVTGVREATLRSCVSSSYHDLIDKYKKQVPTSLPLRLELLLFVRVPDFKCVFKSEELASLKGLCQTMLVLYRFYRKTKFGLDDAEDLKTLKKSLLEDCLKLGVSHEEYDKQLLQAETKVAEHKTAKEAVLMTQLESDEAFLPVYLKMVKDERKMCTTEERFNSEYFLEEQKVVNQLKQKDEFDIDTFINLHHSIRKTLGNLLLCSLCGTVMKNPEMLPCLHTFCLACLEYRTKAAKESSICCPRCQSEPIKHWCTNPAYVEMLNLYHSCTGTAESIANVECKVCIRSPSHLCLDCSALFCADHLKTILHEPHAVTALADFTDKETVLKLFDSLCQMHFKKFTSFCTVCQLPVCFHSDCIASHAHGSGSTEYLTSLEEEAADRARSMSALSSRLDKKCKLLKNKVTEIEKNRQLVNDIQKGIIESMTKRFADIEEALREKKQMFQDDVMKESQKCLQSDDFAMNVIHLWLADAEKTRSLIASALSTGSSGKTQASIGLIRMRDLKREILERLADNIHGVSVTDRKKLLYPESELQLLQQSVSNLRSNISAVSIGGSWDTLMEAPGIRSFVLHGNYIYVITRNLAADSRIMCGLMNAPDGSQLTSFPSDAVPSLFQSLAVTEHGELVAAEECQMTFEVPSLRFRRRTRLSVFGRNRQKKTCFEFDRLNRFDTVLVKCFGDDTYLADNSCVCQIGLDGVLLRKFNFQNMLHVADFSVDRERDLLLVADNVRNSFCLFHCRQQTIQSVGQHGVTPGTFDCPAGIVCDDFGNVLVADGGNCRVQIFDLDGNFLKVLHYPSKLKEKAQNKAVILPVVMQTIDGVLYLLDLRVETIYWIRYL